MAQTKAERERRLRPYLTELEYENGRVILGPDNHCAWVTGENKKAEAVAAAPAQDQTAKEIQITWLP
jgi:hypothetical protein